MYKFVKRNIFKILFIVVLNSIVNKGSHLFSKVLHANFISISLKVVYKNFLKNSQQLLDDCTSSMDENCLMIVQVQWMRTA